MDYPVSTVNALLEAARVNRLHESIQMANDVAAGAVHALEGALGKGQPQTLQKYTRAMLRGIEQTQNTTKDKQERVKHNADQLMQAFGAVVEKKRKRG